MTRIVPPVVMMGRWVSTACPFCERPIRINLNHWCPSLRGIIPNRTGLPRVVFSIIRRGRIEYLARQRGAK